MPNLISLLGTSAAIVTLCLVANEATAQNDPTGGGQTNQLRQRGRQRQGNFDPAQFQQRMVERYRERLEITDDAEWKAVQPLIQNVMDARMAAGTGVRGAMGRGTRRGGQGDQTAPGAAQGSGRTRENSAAQELQKAIEAKAPAPEMKAALTKYLEYRKAKQADLDKARDALRAVLTSRQEAIATLSGLL